MPVGQELFDNLFLITMIIIIAGILWMPVTWLFLSVFTPKELLDKYFKEPHFSPTETIMLKEFPGFLIRTGIFAWLALRPSLDKKRGIKNIEHYMPKWYAILLKAFMIGVLMTLLSITLLMIILFFN
ncbi:MAG: hypothetical protein ACRBCI_11730 [Cellvibrionaceae bacterium]